MGYTYEQLIKMGATPVAKKGMTLQELQAQGATPVSQSVFPKEEPQTVKDGFWKSLLKDPIKTLVVKPGARVAQAGVGLYGAATGNERLQNAALQDTQVKIPLLGTYDIEGQKGGVEGLKQVGSDALKSGVYLATPGISKGATTVAGKAAQLGANVVKGAGVGYVSDVASNLEQNKEGVDILKPGMGTVVGGSIPLVAAAAKGVGYIAKEVTKHISSSLSGVPKAAIEEAFNNPTKVQKAIQIAAQDGEGATQRVYNQAVEAMDTLKNVRKTAYEQNLAKLEKGITYTKNGQMYVKRVLSDAEAAATKGYVKGTEIGVPTKLSTSGIKNVFSRTLKEFGADVKGQNLDFTNVALDDTHISKLVKLQDRIYKWNDITPTGINRLKQVIQSYRVGGVNLGSSESKFNKIITDLSGNTIQYLEKRVPQVEILNKTYQAQTDVINNIRNQLKLGSADPNTALRKLVNVFNPKSEVYRPIVKQLGDKAGKDLMADIAGLTMSKWTPEGLGKYLTVLVEGGLGGATVANPAAALGMIPTAAMASPRVVGSTVTKLGKVAQNKTAKALGQAVIGIGKQVKKVAIRKSSEN